MKTKVLRTSRNFENIFAVVIAMGLSALTMISFIPSWRKPGTWSKSIGLDPMFACHKDRPPESLLDLLMQQNGGRWFAFSIFLILSFAFFLTLQFLWRRVFRPLMSSG